MDGPPKSRQVTTNSPWGLFDSLEIGVAVTHPDGTLEFCNASLLQLATQSTATLPGSSIFNSAGVPPTVNYRAYTGPCSRRTSSKGPKFAALVMGLQQLQF